MEIAEKGYCLLDYNKSIIFVCNPAFYGKNINFYMSFMLTGYPINGRRASLFSFFNKNNLDDHIIHRIDDGWRGRVRYIDKLFVEVDSKGEIIFNVFGTVVRREYEVLINKWVVLHLRIDAVSGFFFH